MLLAPGGDLKSVAQRQDYVGGCDLDADG